MQLAIKDENQSLVITRIINMFGAGVPPGMVIRELVINGIEAIQLIGGDGNVYIEKDHQSPHKLAVINTDGKFLSRRIAEDHLLTLAMTGNDNFSVREVGQLDTNKGIGAKISYLPQADDGLRYRSKERNTDSGISFQMSLDREKNIYHLPEQIDITTGKSSAFISEDNFSAHLSKELSGTEVICMGHNEEDNTWALLDKLFLPQSNASGGTGLGIAKFAERRLWVPLSCDVKVAIYEKTSGAFRWYHTVQGLLAFMKKQLQYGIQSLEVEGYPFPIAAHWAIMAGKGEAGFNTNVASAGFTAMTYRGEVYEDMRIHPKTRLKHLKDCGILYSSSKVMIVFEFPPEIEGFQTTNERTGLIYNNVPIDENLLFAAFRASLPPQIVEWLTEQVKSKDHRDRQQWLRQAIDRIYCPSTKPSSQKGGELPAKRKKRPSKPLTFKQRLKKFRKNKEDKKLPQPGRLGWRHLKNGEVPKVITITEENAELVEFHVEEYTIVINEDHEIYKHRLEQFQERLKDLYPSNTIIKDWITTFMALNTICKIRETYGVYGDREQQNELKERWGPQALESIWTPACENAAIKTIKEILKEQEKIDFLQKSAK